MATIRWQGNVSNVWNVAGNWIGAAVPVHGDDVQFLGADLGANRCGVGPTAIVLLDSIYADAAYDTAVNATVCYANCGMDGAPLETVILDGDSYIAGGYVDVAEFNANSSRVTGGTVETLNVPGGNQRVTGGSVTTANISGTGYLRVQGGTIGTIYANGSDCNLNGGVVGTVYGYNFIRQDWSAVTTVYIYGDTSRLGLALGGVNITNLYIYANNVEVSLVGLAAGKITNGPYMCGLDQVLLDRDTGEVIADLSQIPSYSAGAW